MAKGRTYPRLHKVIELAALCSEMQEDLEPLKTDLKLVDEFYIPTRYPDAIPGGLPDGAPGADDAQLALQTAKTILALVRSHI